jgi:hypothetical protein
MKPVSFVLTGFLVQVMNRLVDAYPGRNEFLFSPKRKIALLM